MGELACLADEIDAMLPVTFGDQLARTMSEVTTTSPLTVVLVHGAFADSSSWSGVIERLQANGVQVMPPLTRCAVSPSTARTSPGTDVVRAHAERAGAAVTEVDGSHVIMISQPQAVTEVIEAAIAKLR